jgi:hypothetical protein
MATVCDTIVVKRAVRTAVGESSHPATRHLPLPQTVTTGHIVNPEFARFAADLIVRLGPTQPPTRPNHLISVGTFSSSSGNHNGWLLQSDAADWIVFRGTSTRDEWDRDFEMQQTPFLSRLLTKNIRKMAYPKLSQKPQTGDDMFPPDALVHSGFLDIYLDIRDLLLKAVALSDNTRVCVTGHSLGGALAQFATYDIATNQPNKVVDTIVFGCPRVGNPVFAQHLTQAVNVNSFVMLTNTCDLVPNLPLAVQPIVKSSVPLIYAHPTGSHNFTDNRGTWTKNHMMGVYIDHIESMQ